MTESMRDYLEPDFCGVLTRDHFAGPDGIEHSTVRSALIGDVHRAGDAICTIAPLVHNSLCEPDMSGVEPLGLSAHLGLLNAAELVGKHLAEIADKMRDADRS